MEGTMMSPADYAAINRGGYGDMGFGGNGIWFLALLFLFGFGGRGGFGADGRAATVDELNSTSNFARLESQVQGIGSAIASGFRNVDNAVCQLGYQGLENYSNLSKELASCCCETQRAVDSVKFDMANYASAINANTTAQTQKILDAIAQNKIESLQAQVNKLELQNSLCGVIRYPTSSTYNAGVPFPCNTCNGCGF